MLHQLIGKKDKDYDNDLYDFLDNRKDFCVLEQLSCSEISCSVKAVDNEQNIWIIKQQNKKYSTDKAIQIIASIEGLPELAEMYETEHNFILMYPYISGLTLTEYINDRHIIIEQAVRICIELCEIVSVLHKLKLIHGDIKTDNIIINDNKVNNERKVYLIDTSTVTLYEGKKTRSRYAGTTAFSAPETLDGKISFSSDLYSIGKVLSLLINETDEEPDYRLRKIVRKANQNDSLMRYKSADILRKALINYKNHNKYILIIPVVAALVICLFWGINVLSTFSGIDASIAPSQSEYTAVNIDNGISFADPVIGAAIRCVLEKNDDEPVYENELLSIKELVIIKDKVLKGTYHWDYDLITPDSSDRQHIESLEDLKLVPNLETLFITHTDIGDITQISQLKNLKVLNISSTLVSDLTPLVNMPCLDTLSINYTDVRDLSPLSQIDTLYNIAFLKIPCENYDFAGDKTQFGTIQTQDNDFELLKPILDGLEITMLHLSHIGMKSYNDLPKIIGLKKLSITYYNDNIYSIDGIEIYDELIELKITGNQATDFSPILKLNKLEVFITSPENKEYIEKISENVPFLVRYE